MKKLTCKQINYFIQDEGKAIKQYNKLGLPSLASDERKHQKFFQRQAKKCGCK